VSRLALRFVAHCDEIEGRLAAIFGDSTLAAEQLEPDAPRRAARWASIPQPRASMAARRRLRLCSLAVGADAPQVEATPSRWRPLGRYELGPRLASGGMAELYVARTAETHGFRKYLAVKRILPKWADDHEFVEMFLDEARLAAQLDHPNVVHVHDIGEDHDGFYFTMEYIHGQNLLAIMRRARDLGRAVSWAELVAVGSAAAAGLHHAHDRRGFDGRPLGIIHRDVSPTNILVTYEGVVKLVDFGIAKASTSRHSTRPSVRKGKMAYMSPEQCRSDDLDRRSDVFALGVVLYELATLRRAFCGEGEFAVMNQIVNHDLAPPSTWRADIPEAIERLIMRTVSRDPDARPATARDLQRELDAYAVEAGIVATPQTLARAMDELFGATPYPWEIDARDDVAADAPTSTRTAATRVRSGSLGQPVEADDRVVPEQAAPAPARGRRRAAWWTTGGLAAGAAAAIMAFATRDATDPPTTDAPLSDSLPRDSLPRDSLPRDSLPSDSRPADSRPRASATSVHAAPSAATPKPDAIPDADSGARPDPRTDPPPTAKPASKPDSRPGVKSPARTTTKADAKPTPGPEPRPEPSSALLPAPFDPDAPAPRVR
jgi:serine/threonine protein kinase